MMKKKKKKKVPIDLDDFDSAPSPQPEPETNKENEVVEANDEIQTKKKEAGSNIFFIVLFHAAWLFPDIFLRYFANIYFI